MGWFPSRLRTRLLLTCAVAVLPALFLIAYEQSVDRQRARQDTLDRNSRLTHLVADRLASVFTGAQRLLQTLTHVPEVRTANASACNAVLPEILADHPGYLNLAAIRVDGVVWCSSSPATVSLAVADRPWFQGALQSHATTLGEYQVGRTTATPDIVVAQPVLDPAGRVEHVLAAALELSELDRILATMNPGPGGTLTLFDRNRTILARYPDGPKWVGTKIRSSLPIEHLLAGAREDRYETVGVDGVHRLYATVVVDPGFGADLFMSVGMDTAAALADANRVTRQQLLLLALAALAVIAAAVVAGQTLIVGPVEKLRAVTKRLAAGDFSARAHLARGVEELSALGDTVDAMAIAIEQRERERDAAERGRRLLASIVDDSEDAIFSKRLDGTITSWNVGAEKLYGYSAADIVGRSVQVLTPPDRQHELSGLLERLRRGEHLKHHETVRQRKDGTLVPVSLTLSPIRDEHGLVVGASSIARDVTDRIQAVAALHNAEERMRFALNAARVGVWEVNLSTGTTYWSETCEAMHGLTAGSFGRTFDAFMDRVHPDDRPEMRRIIEEAARDRRDAELEYRTVWPDGTEHHIRATGRFFYDEHDRPLRGAGVAIDVSERRGLEDQLRQAQKMDAVGRLAGGIAHDFNNVLTAILGNAEFVLDDLPADSPLRADVIEIKTAADRAAALTHQLLAFSRKQILAPRVLHLGDVVGGVAPMLRRLIGETIELKATMTDRGHVKADGGQMEQVLVNLAVNARDAMPNGGRLTIETADVVLDDAYARQHAGGRAGPHVMLAVSDTGHGMDAATRARVFEPFFTTKPMGAGTGLGLATVYGIVKQSGGQVWVYSEVGRGTTFKIYLPRTDEPGQDTVAPAADERPVHGDETILLVEDEEFVREFVHKVLTRHGYAVHAVPDSARAVSFARAHHGTIHLILTDVVLADLNGRAMAGQVLKLHPESKVLYMSGYTDNAIVHQGVLDPDMWFLQKPFAAGTLARRVRERLDAEV